MNQISKHVVNPTEKKRRNYLVHFEEGAEEALIYQHMDETKKSSAYYRRGFDFGMKVYIKIRSIK